MKICRPLKGLQLLLLSTFLSSYSSYSAIAQIIPDSNPGSSLGTIVTPNGTITGGTTTNLTATGLVNLFHSFSQFDIGAGGNANFVTTPNTANIFARIGSQNPSSINGVIQVSGSNANLFLMNPNGIIFGPNASLNIGGSFVATTANSIQFEGGSTFDMDSQPTNIDRLLTIKPEALLFNQIAAQTRPNSIIIEGNLSVNPGRSLLLVGGNPMPTPTAPGNILINGGTLQASGGHIGISAIAGFGTVNLHSSGDNPVLPDLPSNISRANVWLTNRTAIDARISDSNNSIAKDSIVINAQNLTIEEGSYLWAGVIPKTAQTGQAGNITLDVTEKLKLTGVIPAERRRSSIINSVGVEGETGDTQGNAGDITIRAKILNVNDGAQIFASTFGQGNAGDINILADEIYLKGGRETGLSSPGEAFIASLVQSRVERNAQGKAGIIRIDTNNILEVTDGAFISASTNGKESAGIVSINAPNGVVRFQGEGTDGIASGAYSQVLEGSTGDAGKITITAKSILLQNGGKIQTNTKRSGKAGDIEIKADEILFDGEGKKLELKASGAFSLVDKEATGGGGKITVKDTNLLRLTNGAVIITRTDGKGDAGDIVVENTNTILIDGRSQENFPGGIIADTRSGANAGSINIQTNNVFVRNGARISAETSGVGNAGTLIVNTELIKIEGKDSEVNLDTLMREGGGDAGILSINAQQLFVHNGGKVTAKTSGSGRGGFLDITATELIHIDGENSILRFETSGSGNAIGLTIKASKLVVSNGGEATVRSLGETSGSPGNLIIDADSILLFNRGKLSASTFANTGGNIDISFKDILMILDGSLDVNSKPIKRYFDGVPLKAKGVIDGSEITASAFGNASGGNITLTALNGFVVSNGIDKNNDVLAFAFQGDGGKIISTLGYEPINFILSGVETPLSDFTASSLLGRPGELIFNIKNQEPEEALPTDFLNSQIAQGCRALRAGAGQSKFVYAGNGGLPSSPHSPLNDTSVEIGLVGWGNSTEPQARTSVHVPIQSQPEPIVEAQQWIRHANGSIELVAQAPVPVPLPVPLPLSASDCGLNAE